jgi:NDP-sugar pyrophosphorylase family protein
MDKHYLNSKFFDISSFAYPDILGDGSPWQSISLLSPFILELFAKGTLTANYLEKKYVFVGENTVIHPSVEIEGPALIGSNCRIGHGAYLREGCVLGDNVNIGHAVEIKQSIILNNSVVAHLNYVGDSVIGNNVNISGGTIVANFRLDKKNIVIKTPEGEIDTKLQKFGAAIGDNSMIGVNSVLNPGTLLGKNTKVYPLKSITGVHEENAIIR